ncbi:MAG: hypothetical protein JNL92_12345 [Opitutaceae bacterium]|nr:hypothetical protein [Opitutaceae bacterium]
MLPFPFMVGAAAVTLALCGCASPRVARIEEHAAVFAALRAVDQEKIRQGLVDVGFLHQHVYMALGRPSRILRPANAGEDTQTWVYHNFVYGTTSAATIAPTQTGSRYEGTQITAAAVRGGVTSTPRGAPTSTVDLSGSGVGTLLIDLVDGVVVRIRLEP